LEIVRDAAPHHPSADPRDALVRAHWHGVRRYVRVLGASADRADDLTQDAFVVALRNGIEDRGAATGAYLRRTARFLFLKTLRRRDHASLDEAHLVWQEQCADDDGAAYERALLECRTQLGDRAQRALTLRYEQNAPREEIARALAMSVEGIKTLLRRSRAALRECIQRRRSQP